MGGTMKSRVFLNSQLHIKMILGLLVAMAAVLLVAPSAHAQGNCTEVQKQVALTPGHPSDYTIHGTVCLPDQWAPGEHQIDVLVHGATYNRSYWDWPQQSPTYSYVQRTLQAGRATFAYDTVGTGQNSLPLSATVTPAVQAFVLHQLLQMSPVSEYSKVTTVGHSFGSIIAIHEASVYQDVDRLVVTGLLHASGPNAVTGAANFYPAMLDPKFIGTIFDPGYITSLPGVRGTLFYSSTADPAVIQYDEQQKDVVSGAFFGAGLAETQTPALLNISRNITAPVLTISGDQDGFTCGLLLDCTNQSQVQANETPYYPSAASLTTQTVSNTGHNLNLHPSVGTSFMTINSWIQTH